MSHPQTGAESVRTEGPARAAHSLMLLMFCASGVAALVYQVAWARKLYLVFGVTIFATSAVVTTFMAGLALGSLYFGRMADRWKRPLVLFALLELGIGAFGALFPFIVRVLEPVYVAFYGPLGRDHYVMSLVRFALSFAVLLVPTSLMGGTLPVLSRAYVSQAKRLGREVAGLYAANNVGAFAGCLLAGYAFIELLGVNGSLLLAASLNVLVAAAALALDAGLAPRAPAEEDAAPEAAHATPHAVPRAVKVALWVFGIEGFTSLAYQMAWMRMLVFFVQTNVYAITAIVATFLLGLSVGSFAVRRWVDETRNPYRLLGLIELGIALTALASIPLLPLMFRFHTPFQHALWRHGWAGATFSSFALTSMVILLPTAFMGATMPVVSRIYVPALGELGRKMGVIGCLDTVGSIVGAFAGGFVLIPLLGIQRTIIATAMVNLALAAWVFRADPARERNRAARMGLAAAGAGLAAAACLLLLPRMPLVKASSMLAPIREARVLRYEEGIESTVAVVDAYDCSRMLVVNQAIAAQTDRLDRPSHEMIAHIPILLHPHPKRVLLIGFGIGFTSWACRVHDTDVDVVELSPEVRRANEMFRSYNNDILSDGRVHLRIDDGRNYVLGTEQRYDVIQAGIIHPALSSGNAGFYTVDFYRQCKRILARGGVMCQWLPVHGMPHEDFKTLIRSFQEVFPYTSLWYKQTAAHCTLVGTEGPLKMDFADIERRVSRPQVRAHIARCDVQDVYDLLDSFCLADEALRKQIGPGPLHTDDHPLVEFHCSRPFLASGYLESVRLLDLARQPVWPLLVNVAPDQAAQVRQRLARWAAGTHELNRAQYSAALMEVLPLKPDEYARAFGTMDASFQQCLQVNPEDANARYLWRAAMSDHYLREARGLLTAGRRAEAAQALINSAEAAPAVLSAGHARYLYRTEFPGAPLPAAAEAPATDG